MRIAQRFSQLIEYFLPQAIRSDRDAADQAKMFLISHILGPVIGNSIPLAFFLFDPTPSYEIAVLSLAITAFWIFPFLLRAGFNYDRLVLVSVVNLNFCIFWSCWFNDGIHSPTLAWILVIPLLSFLYIGGRKEMRRPLLLIFGVCGFSFFALYQGFAPSGNDIPEAASRALALVSTTAALLYVSVMAIYYSRVSDRSIELEAEVRRRQVLSRELRVALSKSTEASQAKAQFLARMSHELRTPLNAVIGYSEVLREDMEENGRLEMLPDIARINGAGKYLMRLINSILDLSKIDAGRMQFDVRQQDLRSIVLNTIEANQAAAEDRGNRIELSYASDKRSIETDGPKLSAILDCIVHNAVGYTRNGDIRVRIGPARIKDLPFFRIEIEDDGCGISETDLASLFELHGDGREATQSQFGGTGMSLIVSRRMIRSMGGDIEVRSILEEGSVFSVLVPVSWPGAAPTAGLAQEDAPHRLGDGDTGNLDLRLA